MRKYDFDEENAKLEGLQVIFEDGENEDWEDEEDNWRQWGQDLQMRGWFKNGSAVKINQKLPNFHLQVKSKMFSLVENDIVTSWNSA